MENWNGKRTNERMYERTNERGQIYNKTNLLCQWVQKISAVVTNKMRKNICCRILLICKKGQRTDRKTDRLYWMPLVYNLDALGEMYWYYRIFTERYFRVSFAFFMDYYSCCHRDFCRRRSLCLIFVPYRCKKPSNYVLLVAFHLPHFEHREPNFLEFSTNILKWYPWYNLSLKM